MTQKPPFLTEIQLGHRSLLLTLFLMVSYLYASVFTSVKIPSSVTSSLKIEASKPIMIASEKIIQKVPVSSVISSQKEFKIQRTYAKRFSSALGTLTNISSRKEMFVKNLLPSILIHNEKVLMDRQFLLDLKKIKDSGKTLSAEQNRLMKQIMLKYKVKCATLSELLQRVDVIPPSLALGQAVVETGWGGSLAAQRFNSPFGMMKTSQVVFSYESLEESVSHYIHNLNTYPAYQSMRSIRAHLRAKGDNLCSLKLVNGIGKYSEIGHKYISRVKNIIQSFKLQHYDNAQLTSYDQQL